MRAGFNPSRRNRNIGTPKQGRGEDNRLVIPKPRNLFSMLDRIGNHTREERLIQGRQVSFIIEHTREGSLHPCTVQDVARILDRVPASDWSGIGTIIFRQPTRKQAVLNPAWGRLCYFGEVSTARGQPVASGPMIFLDAIDEGQRITWPVGLDPDDQEELDRLRADGHAIERKGRHYVINVVPASARNTQLYRTLPHEIGHWFDWLEKVETPAQRGEDFSSLQERYFARPPAEREAFAHRYADRLGPNLRDIGSPASGTGTDYR